MVSFTATVYKPLRSCCIMALLGKKSDKEKDLKCEKKNWKKDKKKKTEMTGGGSEKREKEMELLSGYQKLKLKIIIE